MYSILHISDLHRTREPMVSNDELVSALLQDRTAYTTAASPIRAPDAIVVSGDIVQGVKLGATDATRLLADQYAEAETFLGELADRMLGGDRSRVIIVPGNHDIDWNVAKASMRLAEFAELPSDLPGALYEPNSLYRWSWPTRELFIITDIARYSTRLDAFWDFFDRFYAGVPNLLRVERGADVNLFSLLDGRIGVAAFNSCHGNDCFAFHGAIPAPVVARADLDLASTAKFDLRIAVWHHNLDGPPYRTDYMDIEVVRGMIGREFRLGLYGHQHRAHVAPHAIHLQESQTMVLAGTGTLCAGGKELPSGHHRQYSIIELNDDLTGARFHVREIKAANLFGPSDATKFGEAGSTEIFWAPRGLPGSPSASSAKIEADLLRGEELFSRKLYQEAIDVLQPQLSHLPPHGTHLLREVAAAARDWPLVSSLTESPESISELLMGFEARLELRDFEGAKKLIADDCQRLQVSTPQKDEMEKRLRAVEALGR